MRKGIDCIGICVVFYCHDGNGNLLLHKRSLKCRDEQGRWDVGGGALEHGETFEEAVNRELSEEYGTTPLDLKPLGTHNVLRISNGEKTHWIALVFSALLDPQEVKITDPDYMDDIGWFPLDDLPTPLHSQFDRFFPLFKNSIS